jgi:uncharacterized protein (DUF934 family)
MPRLIDTSGTELVNEWVKLEKDSDLVTALACTADKLLVPLELWQNHEEDLRKSGKELGVWLDSDQQAAAIAADLERLKLVALNFPGFTDGRSYSTANNLRRHYHYTGEIRAIGDVLRDQLFYMRRCGFSTFDLKDTVKLEEARTALGDFKDSYQSTIEQPAPLFRRRLQP